MQTAITLIVLITMIVFSKHILSSMLKYDPIITEKYQIKYPIEPMSENYFDIVEEIENCTTEHDMKRAYVRIIIFLSFILAIPAKSPTPITHSADLTPKSPTVVPLRIAVNTS